LQWNVRIDYFLLYFVYVYSEILCIITIYVHRNNNIKPILKVCVLYFKTKKPSEQIVLGFIREATIGNGAYA